MRLRQVGGYIANTGLGPNKDKAAHISLADTQIFERVSPSKTHAIFLTRDEALVLADAIISRYRKEESNG